MNQNDNARQFLMWTLSIKLLSDPLRVLDVNHAGEWMDGYDLPCIFKKKHKSEHFYTEIYLFQQLHVIFK
jgi:hypothetical protein